MSPRFILFIEFPFLLITIHRPDQGRSDKRGNFQLLPNGNAFVGWSENSYISEHHPDGRVLMEAQFISDRFVTYRAYKFNFTSRAPAEPPVLKAFVYGTEPEKSISVYHVSWNGATEVAEWAFYDDYEQEGRLLGKTKRTGFETAFQSFSFAEKVYAEAIDKDGNVLGKAEAVSVIKPSGWKEGVEDISAEAPEGDEWSKSEL